MRCKINRIALLHMQVIKVLMIMTSKVKLSSQIKHGTSITGYIQFTFILNKQKF